MATDMTIKTCVELFCGIGGFRLACDDAGIETLWANDISTSAGKVYRDRFGSDVFRLGDLHELLDEIPNHDLLTAGFPCQPFSSAGKKLGVLDPRGSLFELIVSVVNRHRPKVFILENVKRLLSMQNGSHFATILAALSTIGYHIEWRLLNARHFGLAQNRERVIIVGTRSDVDIPGPASIRLAAPGDLSSLDNRFQKMLESPDEWSPVARHKKRFLKWGVARDGRFLAADLECFNEALPPVLLRDVLDDDVPPEFDFTESTIERMRDSDSRHIFVQGVEILSNQDGGARMGYTVFGISGLAPTLTSTASRHYERYRVGDRYRRLTNKEYAKLQGFPVDHCRRISTYGQYALFGNAVPPPMVSWVLRRLDAPCSAGDLARLTTDRQMVLEYA